MMTVAVDHALARDMDVIVSSGVKDTAPKWQELATRRGAIFSVRTIDPPGIEIEATMIGVIEDAKGRLTEYEITDIGQCIEDGVSAVSRWDAGLGAQIAAKLI